VGVVREEEGARIKGRSRDLLEAWPQKQKRGEEKTDDKVNRTSSLSSHLIDIADEGSKGGRDGERGRKVGGAGGGGERKRERRERRNRIVQFASDKLNIFII